MKLHHKALLVEVRVDENGIFASSYPQKRFCWETIVSVIGYRKKKLLGLYNCIGFAIQEKNSDILHLSPIETRDTWQYKYFLESIVQFLASNHNAKGGKAWCARPLDKEGRLIEDNDLYRSYVLCRILADRIGTPWLDHAEDDEAAIAVAYLRRHLIKDGAEYKQISDAIEKTRFPVQEDGSINMFTSVGYRILDDARSIILSKKA
jgi:hypothetical protein